MRSAFTRLEKLEQSVGANGWIAYFKVAFYDKDIDREKAQKRMKNEYLAAGHPPAALYLFINEIPGHNQGTPGRGVH